MILAFSDRRRRPIAKQPISQASKVVCVQVTDVAFQYVEQYLLVAVALSTPSNNMLRDDQQWHSDCCPPQPANRSKALRCACYLMPQKVC